MKTKRVQKTKEQLIKDLQSNKKFQEKMEFTKNKFYPALIKATVSIEDALQNLSIINSVLMDKFLASMKEKKFKDVDIYSNLSEKDPQYENLKAMLNLFDDMTVFDAKELLEGMKSEITFFLNEEQKNRTLKDLKVRWLDEI